MKPLYITGLSTVSAIGHGLSQAYQALLEGRSGLRPCDFEYVDLNTYIGRVPGLESQPVDEALIEFDCRNNRLAQLALNQDNLLQVIEKARMRYGAQRIGIFIGTSTSGGLSTELAYQQRNAKTGRLPKNYLYSTTHNNYSITDFVQRSLKLRGPALTISTACSSSAKVFATAYRYISSGLCDAALVGGVDSLCMTTLYGFSSLELVSEHSCKPADRDRDGISIGEAGGFALLETAVAEHQDRPIGLLGYGESSDAYHMSSPQPDGYGAQLAMQQALDAADLVAGDIDYINLHGTATPANDRAEDRAVSKLFGNAVPCSSTKGWTGHTLGAAGITEVAFSYLCIKYGFIPASLNTNVIDSELQSNINMEILHQPVERIISNSFGFGGNNCSLLIGVVNQ